MEGSEDCGGGQKIVEGEHGKGSSAQWLAQAGKPRTPRVVVNFHPLIPCILGFCILFLSIMPSGVQIYYVKTLIKIHKTIATENNMP